MPYLVDTNVFLRLVSRSDPDRGTVVRALRNLRARNEDLYYTTQVLAEFWAVCTRPATARGGYGLSAEKVGGEDGKKGARDRALLSVASGQHRDSSRVATACCGLFGERRGSSRYEACGLYDRSRNQ